MFVSQAILGSIEAQPGGKDFGEKKQTLGEKCPNPMQSRCKFWFGRLALLLQFGLSLQTLAVTILNACAGRFLFDFFGLDLRLPNA